MLAVWTVVPKVVTKVASRPSPLGVLIYLFDSRGPRHFVAGRGGMAVAGGKLYDSTMVR